jgi:hypothetical protein
MMDWECTALIIAPVHEMAWARLPAWVDHIESIESKRRAA